MRLKEFITRSGCVITAIALLGSMMSMAGAAGLFVTYTCTKCGSYKESFESQFQSISMKSVYGIDNIPTLGSELYYLSAEPNKYFVIIEKATESHSSGTMICESCLEKIISEYKAANSGTISSPGTGSTPITLTAAASTFNVTVPTSIPLVVGADSKVTSPSDVKIINNSAGPVKVTAIAMNDGVWTITDYNGGDRSKLAAEKVGSNKLGLSLTAGGNTVASSKNGNQSPAIDSTKWRITGKNTGNNGLPITVGAIASAVSTKIENAVTAANVVFTVAWDK